MKYTEEHIISAIEFALKKAKTIGSWDDDYYLDISPEFIDSLHDWVKESTSKSMMLLIANGRIENVGEGNDTGALICEVKYLKNNKKLFDSIQIKMDKLPLGTYKYVSMYIENGYHVISELNNKYFIALEDLESVEDFLKEFYKEQENEFYDNRDDKKFY